MMHRLVRCALVLFVTLAAQDIGATKPKVIKVAHLPPSPKDVVDAAMALADTPLSDATCKGFGTEPGDKTIGRYLAGYLAELSDQNARNAITTSVEQGTEKGAQVYVCVLMIRHARGEDIWSWGIRFSIRKATGVVVPETLQCVGAG